MFWTELMEELNWFCEKKNVTIKRTNVKSLLFFSLAITINIRLLFYTPWSTAQPSQVWRAFFTVCSIWLLVAGKFCQYWNFKTKGFSFLNQCFLFWKSVSDSPNLLAGATAVLLETLFQNRNCAKHWYKKLKPLGDAGFFRLQGINVLWRLQLLEYLRTLCLKFQKAQTKIEIVLTLSCWLSQAF